MDILFGLSFAPLPRYELCKHALSQTLQPMMGNVAIGAAILFTVLVRVYFSFCMNSGHRRLFPQVLLMLPGVTMFLSNYHVPGLVAWKLEQNAIADAKKAKKVALKVKKAEQKAVAEMKKAEAKAAKAAANRGEEP